MHYKEITVTLKVEAETPARLKDKQALLKQISNLAAEDQNRIITICKNPKALKSLSENWDLLQSMF